MKNETIMNTPMGVRAITKDSGLWFVWRDVSKKITGSVNPDLILDLFSDEDKSTATIDGRELVTVNTHALLGLLYRQFIRTVFKDGQVWWVLKDVCNVLNITNPRKVA